MAKTESKMLPLGTIAPDFALADTDGKLIKLSAAQNKQGHLIMFICNHCPFVKHIAKCLSEVTSQYMSKGIDVYAINSNDVLNYPEDSPEMMKLEKKNQKYKFSYLYDETQDIARAYDAACTPDFFLFDSKKRLVYRGQFDSSRPGNGQPVDGKDLTDAVNALLNGNEISKNQKPSIGCNIKWKAD